MAAKGKVKSAVTYKMIAEALFENYESIYDINLETLAYRTYYQSDFYQELELAKEGHNFFKELPAGIDRTIAPEDKMYVSRMLERDTFIKGLTKEKYFRLVYRIQRGNDTIYHQLRATFQEADDGMHILMGIKNIDDLVRQNIAHNKEVESMRQKEHNHMEAILGSAVSYMEANLTRNIVLEKAVGYQDNQQKKIKDFPDVTEIRSYDSVHEWIGNHLVAENRERYLQIGSRQYLIRCYQQGEKRASVSFSLYSENEDAQPCKAVFYLYREKATDDLYVFSVIYDLTEQQKKEKELRELEEELAMSRIRNSTSQMKPHFLYNALGAIQELVLTEPQYASDLLGDFMIHMRSCVRAMQNDDLIPFSEELKNIKAYVNIEKIRLGDKLDVQYDIEEDRFPVLPLCVQPLVENAIRHGIHKRGKKGGRVIIRTRSENQMWLIQVEDTGIGFNVEKIFHEIDRGKKDSTGLANIRFRLEKVMGAGMIIQSREGEGTVATIRIPKGESRK